MIGREKISPFILLRIDKKQGGSVLISGEDHNKSMTVLMSIASF
jgi:hypothetical protein